MSASMLFEGPDLEEVLEEARRCLGDEINIESAQRVRKGGLLGFFAKEWFEIWAAPDGTANRSWFSSANADDAVSSTAASGAAPDFAAVFTKALDETSDLDPIRSQMDDFFGPDQGAVNTRDAQTASVRSDPSPQLLSTSEAGASPQPTTQIRPAMTPVADPIPAGVALEDPSRGNSVFSAPKSQRKSLLWDMLIRLDALRQAPALPAGPGAVAFVGDAVHARRVAERVGFQSGLWDGDITILSIRGDRGVLPSWSVVNSVDEATQRVTKRLQRDRITPIVIDQPIDSANRQSAEEAIRALDVAQTRLVTEAWRLPDDVGRVVSAIGRVDALDLVEITDTLEPLAMVDLDIPIATIEGRRATSELMAAVWLERRRHV